MMEKQNKIYLGIGIVAVVLIASIMIYSNQQQDEKVIKIGVSLPLTGNDAHHGIQTLKFIEMAVEEINEEGGINGRHIHLIIEDDRCSGELVTSVFNKLINIDNVKAIYSKDGGDIITFVFSDIHYENVKTPYSEVKALLNKIVDKN